MRSLHLATVDPTPTDSRSQRHSQSLHDIRQAAAGLQPKSSARGVVGGSPSRALTACALATEV